MLGAGWYSLLARGVDVASTARRWRRFALPFLLPVPLRNADSAATALPTAAAARPPPPIVVVDY